MNKIEEFIEKYMLLIEDGVPIECSMEDAMIEYAEFYANKCLSLIVSLPQEIPFECFQLPEHE